MSSMPSTTTIIDPNEQATQATMHHDESSAVSSKDDEQEEKKMMLDSSVGVSTSTSTSTLPPAQIRTENDHEDNLMELMDELIHKFLSRPNRRSPYRSFFRWTFDDECSKLSYTVIVNIDASSSSKFR